MTLNETGYTMLSFGFIVFLFISYYYLTRRHTWEGKIGLVFISYIQGVILGVLTGQNLIYNMFVTTVIAGMMYYLLFSKLIMLFEYLKNKLLRKFISHDNRDLTEMMIKIWNIPPEKLVIYTFKGKNSNNAFTKPLQKVLEIYVGEKLLECFSNEEMKFILSHEIAHHQTKRYLLYTVCFPFFYIFMCLIIIVIITFFNLPIVTSYFVFSLILYLLGVIIQNRISWASEFAADRLGFEKTRDFTNVKSAFKKFFNSQKDTKFLNLLFYDHPMPQNRIEKLKQWN